MPRSTPSRPASSPRSKKQPAAPSGDKAREGYAHRPRGREQPGVIAREFYRLAMGAQKLGSREVARIQGPNGNWKRHQGARQDNLGHLDQLHAGEEGACFAASRCAQLTSVDAVPDLILKQSARYQGGIPKTRRRHSGFSNQISENDRAVDVGHHRSSRSSSSSFNNCSSVNPLTGFDGGGQSAPRFAGLIQPSRMPRSITLSCSRDRGGPISATTRLRSVTATVSPAVASRIYSL